MSKKPDINKVVAALKVIIDELGIHLEGAYEVDTPMGKGVAKAGDGEIPPPANGKAYTPEELSNPGTFTRPVLIAIVESLGISRKGMMPNEMRTAIMEAGTPANLGTCDFTEEEGVIVEIHAFDGDKYTCGPEVCALMNKQKTQKARIKVLKKLIEEEIVL